MPLQMLPVSPAAKRPGGSPSGTFIDRKKTWIGTSSPGRTPVDTTLLPLKHLPSAPMNKMDGGQRRFSARRKVGLNDGVEGT